MRRNLFSTIFKTIRNSLFHIVNKEFLIFLFFLALSSIFWIMLAMNDSYEIELRYPIRLTGIPKSVIITDTNSDTFRITVKDKGYTLVKYIYDEDIKSIDLPYSSITKHNGCGSISANELNKIVLAEFDNSTKIVSIKPDRYVFYYNYGTHRHLPVKLNGNVTPDASYYLTKIEFSPKSVDVYGSQRTLDSMKCVLTEKLSIHNLRDTIVRSVKLADIKGIKCVPSQIKMTVYPDVLTEENFEVPIQAQNMPDGKTLRTFPSRIKVSFTVGAAMFRTIRPEMFKVVVDYNDLVANPSEKCSLKVVAAPHGVRNIHTDIQQVDYLIEEQ